jgi:dihydroorotate dehydrogenase
MPDWSYQNVFRGFLFRLPPPRARDVTLEVMGGLARTRFGVRLIEFMGHMAPHPDAGTQLLGWDLPSRVVIGAGLDAHHLGSAALARFGVGILEVGAVTSQGQEGADRVERDVEHAALEYPSAQLSESLEALQSRFEPVVVKRLIRLGWETLEAQLEVMRTLEANADGFTVMPPSDDLENWDVHLRQLCAATSKPVLALIPLPLNESALEMVIPKLEAAGIAGFAVLEGQRSARGWRLSPADLGKALQVTRTLRRRSRLPIIGAGGVNTPGHALALLEAGANLVSLHAGLVYSGPGLPKRINAAVASSRQPAPILLPRNSGWVWFFLLGCGMIFSGSIVGIVGITRVTLPYDEAFLGLTRAQLEALNPYLLDFLRHDRVTLAGTMISVGILYAALATSGVRRGMHWAWNSIRLSGLIGFSSFFLFVLYGYFDVLHAVASLVLLPLFVLGWRAPLPPRICAPARDLTNDRVWRIGLIGQLAFVATGIGLVLAGFTIAGVGAIAVFVPQDLEFMRTTRADLSGVNERLVALIAHDRSGFGGALWSTGVAVLTASLWGFERGSRWLWWTLLISGSVGFALTLGVHFGVGYTSFAHLLPAYIGFCLFSLGLACSLPYLFDWREANAKPISVPELIA